MATPALRKANTPWGKKYVWIGHPRQIRDLQITNVAATVNWFTIQQAMLQGGQEKKSNGIFSGALGTYKDVILLSDNRIPAAPNTTNVFRSLFCGAQAALMGYGKRYGNRRMSWKEKLFDFDNQLGIKAGMIWGCKKTVFNSRDHGVIVVSSYGQPVYPKERTDMATLSSPQVASGWTPRVQEKGVFSIGGEYTVTSTLASGDVIRMLKVPDGVTVLGINLGYTNLPGYDTGVIQMQFNVGDGADTNRFCESHTVGAVKNRFDLCTQDMNTKLDALPYKYDFSDNDPDHFDTVDIQVIVMASNSGTIAGTIKMVALCTMDYP